MNKPSAAIPVVIILLSGFAVFAGILSPLGQRIVSSIAVYGYVIWLLIYKAKSGEDDNEDKPK